MGPAHDRAFHAGAFALVRVSAAGEYSVDTAEERDMMGTDLVAGMIFSGFTGRHRIGPGSAS